MSRHVVTVSLAADVRMVDALLAEHRVSALPVVDTAGRAVGIVSRRERASKATARTAAGLMSSPPVSVEPDAQLGAAARLMQKHGVNHLLVMSGGRLLGIVAAPDLHRIFLREDAEIRADIADGIVGRVMRLNRGEVTVEVHDGVVDLGGTVVRRSDVTILAELVRGIAGVVDVRVTVSHRVDDSGADPEEVTAIR